MSVKLSNDVELNVLNLTAVRKLTDGQRQQLESEIKAVSNIDINWDVVAIHSGEKKSDFEIIFPGVFKLMFMRNLYTWIYILKTSRKYDFVLQRHMSFDPFAFLFSWFVSNRITIHHSKELEELLLIKNDWRGVCASLFERAAGKINAMTVKGFIGVTPEIAAYQCITHHVNKPTFFYPNGIDLSAIALIDDCRTEDELHMAFVCGSFSSWHGLDLLISAASDCNISSDSPKIIVHLVGIVDPPLDGDGLSRNEKVEFVFHGYLNKDRYVEVLNKCDVGIGSLALYRKNLNEASTLKVREYLAMGLPVIAAHKDSSLPDEFNYFYNVEVDNIFDCAIELKKLNVSRQVVRDSSKEYIEKDKWMLKLIDNLMLIRDI